MSKEFSFHGIRVKVDETLPERVFYIGNANSTDPKQWVVGYQDDHGNYVTMPASQLKDTPND